MDGMDGAEAHWFVLFKLICCSNQGGLPSHLGTFPPKQPHEIIVWQAEAG